MRADLKCHECREVFSLEARSKRDAETVLRIAHLCALCSLAVYIERLAAFALQKEKR
jgi:hypothetical protein